MIHRGGKNHLAHWKNVIEEHMFGTAKANTLCAKSNRCLCLVWLVSVCANFQLSNFVGPTHKLGKLLVYLGIGWFHGLGDQNLHNFAGLGGNFAFHNLAGETIDGNPVTFLKGLATSGNSSLLVVDLQITATHDANLTHLTAYKGSVTGCAAKGCKNAAGNLHAANILRTGFLSNQNHLGFLRHIAMGILLETVHISFRIVCKELDFSCGSTRARVNALGKHAPLFHRLALGIRIKDWLQKLVQVIWGNTTCGNRLFLGDQAFVNHVHRETNTCKAGSLAVSCLEHPELVFLYGKFNILHIAVMLFQLLTNVF